MGRRSSLFWKQRPRGLFKSKIQTFGSSLRYFVVVAVLTSALVHPPHRNLSSGLLKSFLVSGAGYLAQHIPLDSRGMFQDKGIPGSRTHHDAVLDIHLDISFESFFASSSPPYRIMDGSFARARQTGNAARLQGTTTPDSGWLVDLTTQNARAPCTPWRAQQANESCEMLCCAFAVQTNFKAEASPYSGDFQKEMRIYPAGNPQPLGPYHGKRDLWNILVPLN